jgi:hypothetical protein
MYVVELIYLPVHRFELETVDPSAFIAASKAIDDTADTQPGSFSRRTTLH